MRFIVTSFIAFLAYLLLTTASGSVALWSSTEIIIGIVFALIAGALFKNRFTGDNFRMLNPKRWFLFVIYLCGPFLWALAKANIEVVCLVITGKINPGILKISSGLENDLSVTMLANSITLTPGTLSVEVSEKSNDLYVHWIDVKEEFLKKMPRDCQSVCGDFPDWVRRIAG
jgi:multicomponent Na+:H+ antiporter subunit E